jgi:hypothetical protein
MRRPSPARISDRDCRHQTQAQDTARHAKIIGNSRALRGAGPRHA